MPASTISSFMPSSQRIPPFATGVMPAAFIFAASSLNSAQVVGGLLAPTFSIASRDRNMVLMR